MKVQTINTSYNCKKPCFQAKFVNDPRGYFSRLWYAAKLNEGSKSNIGYFTNSLPDHRLEIINYTKVTPSAYRCEVLNQTIGTNAVVNLGVDINNEKAFDQLIYGLIYKPELFKENEFTNYYKELTKA